MFKITLKTLKTRLLPLFLIALFSCGEEGTEPTDGVDGTDGFNALLEVQNEAPGTNCSEGGVKISVGQDDNENGILDDAEVASVSFVCNGSSGADGSNGENGASLLARTTAENPGENCENGGTLIEIGADANGNNSLDNNEVQTSFFVCNGLDGADGSGAGSNGLTSLIRVTESSSCSNGGITIELGLDTNDNLELDDDEVDASYDICNGQNGANGSNGSNGLSTLSSVTTEPSGLNCENGGLKIELGLDMNGNGVLDNDEVVSENYVCNGSDGTDGNDGSNGADGSSSITRVSTEDPGDNCTNGGLMIEIGMDDVTPDGILQNDEVDYTYYVCNGADGNDGSDGSDGSDGFNSLIRTTTEAPGANCSNGGIRIDIGLDTNRNGNLEAGEYMGSPLYICDGVDGTNGTDGTDGRNLIVVTDTDVTCPNGGIEFTFGYDDDNNGTIDEVLETALICNGNNGSDGNDGSNGQDGLNSIVRSTAENPGGNCANGGTLIEVGIDDNRNNVLDAPEVDTFFYICNGQDGTNGNNGNNSLITVSSFSGNQNGCTNGGLIILSGIDDNGNGTLNAGEIDATAYVCNGDDGTDGSDGNSDGVFEFYYQEGFDSYTGVLDVSISDKNPTETGETFSVDRGTTDSHGLVLFPELEKLSDLVGEEFQIVEAILYLRGVSGRLDGQTEGNWIGVKTLLSDAPLFEEDAVNWTRANGADENWALQGVTSQDQDGNANGYSDMFQLPPTGNFAFDGYIPLQLSITEVTAWTDKDSGKEANKGLVLLMANTGIQYELDIFTSSYDKDTNFRPLLYIKVKTGVRSRSTRSEEEYRSKWESMSYKEKLAPLMKRINK
ncbi:DUF7151 family protein [Ekhidna sp. To15]|uniref:DUF7151 family protein n=1 Tax=Ekhidna sp. To15 TaxID=3395267 RepID=UPI003F520E6B